MDNLMLNLNSFFSSIDITDVIVFTTIGLSYKSFKKVFLISLFVTVLFKFFIASQILNNYSEIKAVDILILLCGGAFDIALSSVTFKLKSLLHMNKTNKKI